MMTAILNLLMRSDREDGYLKIVHSLADGQTVTKYSAKFFPKFLTNRSLTLCNNSDQTLFSNTLTFARSLRPRFSTSPSGPGKR